MKEISLTRGKMAIVDDEDYDYINQWKWQYLPVGYAARNFKKNDNGVRPLVYMHCMIVPHPEGMQTDHANQNKLDNRRDNLRVCSRSQNYINGGLRADNSSGVRGVVWHRASQKWEASIGYNGKRIHIGLYNDIGCASKAYSNKSRELFGVFSNAELEE